MADFELEPDFTVLKRTKYDTIVTQFESGVEQRRPRRAQKIREWVLQFRNRPASEVATVQTLFDSKQGAYESFTWLNPVDAVTYTVRFMEDSFEHRNHAFGFYDFDLTLVEVL